MTKQRITYCFDYDENSTELPPIMEPYMPQYVKQISAEIDGIALEELFKLAGVNP